MQPRYQHIPPELANLDDYQRIAEHHLPADRLAYIQGGTDRELSLNRNRQALDNIQIYSRILASVGEGTTAFDLLGKPYQHPIFLAPVAHQSLVLKQGELATLAGAEATDSTMLVSTLASVSLEKLAASAQNAHWFQLYLQPTPQATSTLLERAQSAGYQAIVVTLDVPVTALRHGVQRAGFQMPEAVREVNLEGLPSYPPLNVARDESRIFQGIMKQSPGWDDLATVIDQATVPVWVKGVIHPDDAQKAIELGAAGIVVSNHGGRALDSVPASIEALPAIRQAIGADVPVLMDGGIRSGGDVFKAIALGAHAVLIGRPQLYALATAGALGVAHMIRTLREELEVTMALAGCASLADIGPDCLFNLNKEWSIK